MFHRLAVVLLALTAACTGREVQIDVAIPGPDSLDAPVAHLGLVVLPYDRDSVLRTFEAGHSKPTAITHELDSLFQLFRGPFIAYASVAYRATALEEQLTALRARIDSLPRNSAAYDTLYRAFAAGSDSLAALVKARDRAQAALARTRAKLTDRLDTLRAAMSRWEDSTYRGYDSITKALGSGLGREPLSDSTDATGRARLRLPSGDWWIYARSWDPWDPNSEWYWNIRVTQNRVVLDRSSGRRLPRY